MTVDDLDEQKLNTFFFFQKRRDARAKAKFLEHLMERRWPGACEREKRRTIDAKSMTLRKLIVLRRRNIFILVSAQFYLCL
jgi:hypothetical protein